ncbi:hypothetical protein SSX86_003694 [Deinandra increscens subsp. villosa]|uniref:Uncharacterized protein n=1 Tax=Deinandra increscens subsp. villosa TaxID=3103831 RepID=A0AAP0DHR7_9ASTR
MSSGKPSKPLPTKPISLPIKPLTSSSNPTTISLAGSAVAGAIFSTLSSCDPVFSAQQLADIATALPLFRSPAAATSVSSRSPASDLLPNRRTPPADYLSPPESS